MITRTIIILFATLGAAACSSTGRPAKMDLTTPLMTTKPFPAGTELEKVGEGPVNRKFCIGKDDKKVAGTSAIVKYGIMDELVSELLSETGADAVQNARFQYDTTKMAATDWCMLMSGTLVKLK